MLNLKRYKVYMNYLFPRVHSAFHCSAFIGNCFRVQSSVQKASSIPYFFKELQGPETQNSVTSDVLRIRMYMTGSELSFWVPTNFKSTSLKEQILATYRTDDIRCVESNMLYSCTSIVVYILLKYIQKCKSIIML